MEVCNMAAVNSTLGGAPIIQRHNFHLFKWTMNNYVHLCYKYLLKHILVFIYFEIADTKLKVFLIF